MDTGKITLAELIVDVDFSYNTIIDLKIEGSQNNHGKLSLVLELTEDIDVGRIVNLEGSVISVSQPDGSCIFFGKCEALSVAEQAGYKTVQITAFTLSVDMGRELMNRTFQDPSKTLKQILEEVSASYNANLLLDEDVPIPHIVSQQQETDWDFLLRLAGQFNKAVFVDNTANGINISIGTQGFRFFDGALATASGSMKRDITGFSQRLQNGEDSAPFLFDSAGLESGNLQVAAGNIVNGNFITDYSIQSDGSVMSSYASSRRAAGVQPTYSQQTQEALISTVLTGTVMAVDQNLIQVAFDAPGGGSQMLWIPYESSISNSFYCMPDEGDSVFIYYENNGKVICLGSKLTDLSHPEYANPQEKSMTNHDMMIEFKEKAIHLTATKELDREDSDDMISIQMDQEKGITINSGREIRIESDKKLKLFVNSGSGKQEDLPESQTKFAEMEAAGTKKYEAKGGNAIDAFKLELKQDAEAAWDNVSGAVKSMVFWDIWQGLAGKDEAPKVEEEPPFEEGVLTLYGVFSLKIQVGESILEMDTNIIIDTPQFSWMGYVQNDHEMVVEALKDWWETALDGLQLALDIAGFIPGFGAFFDLANAAVSLARGDFAGAAMSALAAIPGIGDAMAATKIGFKATMKAYKAVDITRKSQRALKTVMAIYAGANALASMYRNWDQLGYLWDKVTSGEFSWSDIDDVNSVIAALNCAYSAASAIKSGYEAAKGVEFKLDPKKVDKALADQYAKKSQCRDPIDVVSGSQTISHSDCLLEDISGQFLLTRRYESVHTNPGGLLGSKWMLQIESRLIITETEITVMMPDMHLELFDVMESRYVNKRKGEGFLRLAKLDDGYQLVNKRDGNRYCYDNYGKLIKIINRYGNSTLLFYEGGTLTQLSLANGQFLEFFYKENKVDYMIDSIGRTTKYEYDGEFLTKVTYPNNGTIKYEYTAEGYLQSLIDQNENLIVKNYYDYKGRVVRQELGDEEYIMFYDDVNRANTFAKISDDSKLVFHYNQQKLVTKTVYNDGTYEEFGYDEWENPVFQCDRNGVSSYRQFNEEGWLLKETLPNGLVVEYNYDADGNRLKKWDNTGREIRYCYDALGNPVEEKTLIEPDVWQTIKYEWDSAGRIRKVTDAMGGESFYYYNQKFSLPTCFIDPDGSQVLYKYDEAGRKMEEQSEDGIRSFGYNSVGYKALETDEEGFTTRYHYDYKCNLTEVILPKEYNHGVDSKPGTRYEYDAFNHVVKTINPAGDILAVHYDVEDNILKEINPNAYDTETDDGEGIQYKYDSDGRRTHIFYPDGGVCRMFYDGNGNLIKRVDSLEYDEKTDDGIGYLYEYDEVNRLRRITNKAGIVEKCYQYDLTGNIIKEIGAKGYQLGQSDQERPGTLYRYNYAGWMLERREPMCEGSGTDTDKIRYSLTKYHYDTHGNCIQENRYLDYQTADSHHGRKRQIYYTYDKCHRLVKVEDGTGATLLYSYDHKGRRIQEKSRINANCWREIFYEYSRSGKLQAIRESADQKGSGKNYGTTVLSYDANGNLIKIVTPLGNKILREYDAANRLICEEHIEIHGDIHNRMTYHYDKASNLVSVTDYNQNSVYYNYDWQNRVIREQERNGAVSLTEYDRNGRIIKQVKPVDYQKFGMGASGYQYHYDIQGRLLKTLAPDGGLLQSMEYTSWGALASQQDATLNRVQFEYDLAGRKVRIITATGSSQKYTYDAMGNLIKIQDGNQNQTKFQVDCWGRIIQVDKADKSHEQYAYDYAGNITKATDGNGSTVFYEYNTINQLTKRIDAKGNDEQFYYDIEGRLCEYHNRNQGKEFYRYNMYGDLIRHESDDGILKESWGYTPDGLLKYALGGGMRYDYEYYANGLLKEKKASGRTLLYYEYDANGNKIKQQDFTGKTTEYKYNALDLLAEIYDNGNRQALYEYYSDGTVKRMVSGKDLVTEYSFDGDKNLTDLKTTFGKKVLVDNHYTFDSNGNQLTKKGLEGLTAYAYDQQNRLVEAAYPTCHEAFSYDLAGNRTKQVTEKTVELYHYDENNRLMERVISEAGVSRSVAYRYDLQGNMLQDDNAEYHYDSFNRTETIELLNGKQQRNRYDAEGLRHEMEENERLVQFLFSGREVVAETEADGEIIRYLRGYTLISSDSEKAKTYYHYACDEMGSTTHIVNQSSYQMLNTYRYDAFGNVVETQEGVPNRFLYAGQQFDAATNQYYLQSRYYNPVIGRFTQEDSYYGDGLNLYAYCGNNPVGNYDPSGYNACDTDIYNRLRGEGFSDSYASQKAAEMKRLMDQGMSFEDAFKEAGLSVEITLQHKSGMPINEFERKARALQALGNEGLLYKSENPVNRNPNVTKQYRQNIIDRIYAQYNGVNPEFSNKLINRVTSLMQPDHVWELQLGGPDISSNLRFLDSFTNWDIGTQQIWRQIRNLETGTKIKIKILDLEGDIFER